MGLLSWSDRTKKKRKLYVMGERKITCMLFIDFFFCLAEVFYSFKELSLLSYFLPSVVVIQHDNRDVRKRSGRRERGKSYGRKLTSKRAQNLNL